MSWHWAPDLNLEVREFICRTCDLNLEGSSEIVEAGLPLKVPNDRAAPSDAIEYDSDFYRD